MNEKTGSKKYFSDFKYAFHVILHPFRGFWSLKQDKMGNAWVATTLYFLQVLTAVIFMQFGGFTFNFMAVVPENIDIFSEVLNTGIIVVLWILSNWGLTTLFNGEGSMKDIYIYTAYSLLPTILITLLLTVLSQFLSVNEMNVFLALNSLASIWTGFLLYTGTMTTHQYSGLRTFFILVVIAIGMLIVAFVSVLFFFLLQTLINFVYTIYKEVSMRY